MYRTKLCALIYSLMILTVGHLASQDSQVPLNNDRLVLEVNLSKFGYDAPSRTRRLKKFLDFTDSAHLAIAWLTPDGGSIANARIHMLTFDVNSGNKESLHDESTPSAQVRFFGLPNGNILSCAGNKLELFSPEFQIVRAQRIEEYYGGCQWPSYLPGRGISPTRLCLLLSLFLVGTYHQTLLDTQTFAAIASWDDSLKVNDISDSWLVNERREITERQL